MQMFLAGNRVDPDRDYAKLKKKVSVIEKTMGDRRNRAVYRRCSIAHGRPGRNRQFLPKSAIRNPESAIPSAGFSLLELLVVLVLIGVLSAVAVPSIGRGMATLKLKTSSREIAATLRLARSLATKEQKVYWVGFNRDKNEIELTSGDLQFQKSFTLPEGISIKKVSLLGDPGNKSRENPYYFFSPNGMSEAFEVLIESNRGRDIRVIQDLLIRSPRIEEVEGEGSVNDTER